jgi:hypothetical protein
MQIDNVPNLGPQASQDRRVTSTSIEPYFTSMDRINHGPWNPLHAFFPARISNMGACSSLSNDSSETLSSDVLSLVLSSYILDYRLTRRQAKLWPEIFHT